MDFRRLRSIKPGDSAGLWRPCNQYASCVEGFFLEKQNQWWFLKYIYISIYLPIYLFFFLFIWKTKCVTWILLFYGDLQRWPSGFSTVVLDVIFTSLHTLVFFFFLGMFMTCDNTGNRGITGGVGPGWGCGCFFPVLPCTFRFRISDN